MVVADGLGNILRQDIRNYQEDVGWSGHIMIVLV